MAHKLFVAGFASGTTTDRLRELFTPIAGVESVTIVTDRESGRSRGFGFIEVGTTEAASDAVAKLNGGQLDGRTLRVEISTPSALRSGAPYRSASRAAGNRGRS